MSYKQKMHKLLAYPRLSLINLTNMKNKNYKLAVSIVIKNE